MVNTVTQNVTKSCVTVTDGRVYSLTISLVFAAQYKCLKPLTSLSLSDDRFLGCEGVKPDLVLFCSKLSKSVKDLNRSLDGWM